HISVEHHLLLEHAMSQYIKRYINRYLIGDIYRIARPRPNGHRELVGRGPSEQASDLPESKTERSQRGSHLAILQKLIPGEAISVYFLAQSLSSSAKIADLFMDIAAIVTVGL